MLNVVWAGSCKFRLVTLFLLINYVPDPDKEAMGQGARMTEFGQR